MNIKVLDFGKSMYGGWYINFSILNKEGLIIEHTGEHFETFRDLRKWAINNNIKLTDYPRRDN